MATTANTNGSPVGAAEQAWLPRGGGSIGAASLLADVGHEVPTALLPSLLTSTLGAPAAVLGLVEGVSDALAGGARLAGGGLADDPVRRWRVAVGGYASTCRAPPMSLIGRSVGGPLRVMGVLALDALGKDCRHSAGVPPRSRVLPPTGSALARRVALVPMWGR